jgi:hypothetical protein
LKAGRDRSAAVARARALARDEGVGHVVELRLRPDRFARINEKPVDPSELETVLTAAIIQNADYRRGVDESEIVKAERAMGLGFPIGWRAYLMRETWFRRGSLTNGEFVWLYDPHTSFESWEVWADLELTDRPGMIPIGSDGSRELLTVDGRDPRSAVTLTCNVSDGWTDATLQAPSVEAFVEAVEAGTFVFVFDD